MNYLTRNQLQEINKYAVISVGGFNYGVQSEAALEVIINQPAQVVFGHELYASIWLKAAFILQKITKKHVFVDGNKRTAIMAALFFLHINGYRPKDLELINHSDDFVLAITNSPDNEDTMLEIATWLKACHRRS
ncbi:type II toxin-antitoxin system death-on-curing family toxin [Secundilactobacillus mixtipabuli]|uniref:Death-on-curing family protein n=1 Tax=Secundilactobacillus mixtipabuli TaxID=1435342 RepID=A0A1Z5I9I2_9LACO|nr:type II toxin-antitoxin system death-on-curing family toxin [Secundilactobacillus mixtipabuli]GAW98235.1 death-on-curing family protein [Secundilactobacillus mixtipabuli]